MSSVVQFTPLLVVYSILTDDTPVLFHVIFCAVPAFQISPPFGTVTLIVFSTLLKMVNGLSDTSNGDPSSASLTFTRHNEEFIFGIDCQ